MKLKILTPAQQITATEAEEIVAYGPKGEFGILPGHAHFVTPLAVGRLVFTQAGARHAYLVAGGYMEVLDDEVVVAADQVETAKQIATEPTRTRLGELEKKLGGDTLTPEEFATLTTERDLQQARLSVVS